MAKKSRKMILKDLKQELIERRNSICKVLDSELNSLSCGETISSDNISDEAQASEVNEIITQLAAAEAKELIQINEAIERMVEGKYGVCSSCDLEIALARLEALPYATRCIKCQERYEKDGEDFQDDEEEYEEE